MIKTIILKNCATYSNDGANIENCKKINFFYGPNGSGKSTIGNYLSNLDDTKYSECQIYMDDTQEIDILVYNREFRKRNFKENIPGVFTLGQATIDDINNINEMKERWDQKNDEYSRRKNTLDEKKREEEKQKTSFREEAWDLIFKRNDNDFQEAFLGVRNSKERFQNEVINRFKTSHPSSISRDNLLKRAQTLFAKKPEICKYVFRQAKKEVKFIFRQKNSIAAMFSAFL